MGLALGSGRGALSAEPSPVFFLLRLQAHGAHLGSWEASWVLGAGLWGSGQLGVAVPFLLHGPGSEGVLEAWEKRHRERLIKPQHCGPDADGG